MKKYKLEISLAIIFVMFLVLLLWETLFVISNALPIALLVVCVLFILILLLPHNNKKSENEEHQEAYAPKYFAKSVLSALVGIAVIVAAAIVLNKNNFSKNIDFTSNKVNTLSDETTKFLASLTKQVQIICIPAPNPTDNYCDSSVDLINLYSRNSKNIVNLGTLNLANKALLQKVQPSGYSRLIFMSDNNKSELDGRITESNLTNALVNLIKFKKVVYFLSGNGEPSLTVGDGDRNYGDVVAALRSKAYEVKEWNVKQGKLPDSARVVVVGDNSIAYNDQISAMLSAFVARGGKILLIVNPYREQGLVNFYKSINLKLSDTLLTLNPNTPLGQQIAKQNSSRPPVVITNFSAASPITRVISQVYGPQAVIPVDGARPIEVIDKSGQNKKIRPTVLASAFSAAPITLTAEKRNKIDLTKPFTLTADKNFDANKMWPVAVDVEIDGATPKDMAEVVIFGFSLVNVYSKLVPVTEELVPLTIAHLYQDQELVSIPPRDMGPKQFNLSRNPGAWLPLFAGFLPVMTALIGLMIWIKRRTA